MNFSICLIAKNESKSLPRLISSLKEFQSRNGEIILVDTGSNDNTVEVARKLGCKVKEAGMKFITVIDKELAEQINKRFVIENETPIVKAGNRLFDFASARNYSASIASNDMICTLDADEAYSTFDLDKIELLIKNGWEQFEYSFVYAHDQWGKPAVEFIQSKFYDRRKMKWTGIVHEVLEGNAKRILLDKSVILLEHWQEPGKEHRGNYLAGLAVDCFQNPDKDRQSHYLAREMLYTGRFKSAIKEFDRHIKMERWPAERAQSFIFMGDAYGALNNPDKQLECYTHAFQIDSSRRESLIKTALFYRHNNNFKAAIAYTSAALTIPWADYYANDKSFYTNLPHEILYFCYGWTGNITEAQKHIKKALEYQPLNSDYLRDLRYYFGLPKFSIIIPTMERELGLKRCLDSIKNLNYPQELIETIVIKDEPRIGAPKRVKEGVEKAIGDFIVYGADDMEFDRNSLILAYREFEKDNSLILMAFNAGEVYPDEGNICEHFVFRKEALSLIDGEIFDTEFNHVGVDNLLWAKCKRLKAAIRSEDSKITHYHFTKTGLSDKTYELGWSKKEEDRKLLKKKLKELEKLSVIEHPKVFLSNDYSYDNQIEGWMSNTELNWLYKNAKKMNSICEIGSWMGRSTHALLSGCKGTVYSVDHFMGSENPLDTGNRDVYPEFMKNVGHFENLKVHRMSSMEGVKKFEDKSLDMVFIDGGHQYHEVLEDINAWRLKVTKLLCGHDYNWPEVQNAVKDILGKVESVASIWFLRLDNPLHVLRDRIEKNDNFSFVKMGDGEIQCMIPETQGVNIDGHRYSWELGSALQEAYKFLGKIPSVQIAKWKLGMEAKIKEFEDVFGFKCTADHDLLLNRVNELSLYHYNFWRAIKISNRKKVFVGPKRLEGVVKFLNIDQFVEIPEVNSWDVDGKLDFLNEKVEDNSIYLFSAGFSSKVWIADLLKENENITCIDCGSAFDPLFVGQTRTNQVEQNVLREFYKDLL